MQPDYTNRENRPIRKRGWFRALRRGDLWLICAYNTAEYIKPGNQVRGTIFKEIHFDGNCPPSTGYIVWPTKYEPINVHSIYLRMKNNE